MAPRHLLMSLLLVGCTEYDLVTEGKAEEGREPDTAQDTAQDTAPVPVVDTGPLPTADTGCSVDLNSWDLNARWERSTMSSRVQTDTIGTCTSEAAALPTYPDWVCDDGAYTPSNSSEDAIEGGRRWASWDQEGDVDCHHLTLTVDLPACDWSALKLSSPWVDGVAINDNLYVLLEGETVWTGGTSYGLTNTGGPSETDGWVAEPITELSAELLGEGTVTIDLVVEEREEWGGLGYIEPSLVP